MSCNNDNTINPKNETVSSIISPGAISTSSAGSFESNNSKSKRSVRFCKEDQIFSIPSREQIESLFASQCIQNVIPRRKVFFNRNVTVFFIHSREDLKYEFNDLWYSLTQIKEFQQEELEEDDSKLYPTNGTVSSIISLDTISTSSAGSFESNNSKSKRSVRFCKEDQIFTIPSREQIESLFASQCIQNVIPKLKVSFNRNVMVFFIHSREDLKYESNDLWYSITQIKEFQQDELDEDTQ